MGDGIDAEYDAGYVAGGRVGTRITNAVRVELDVAYSSNEFDDVNGVDLGDLGLDADLSALTFGVGLYTDILPYGAIEPYVGAGIGGAYKEIDTNFDADDDDTDLAAHGEAGLSFELTPNIAIVPHYRLLWLDEVGDDAQFAHWLRVGFRFSQ